MYCTGTNFGTNVKLFCKLLPFNNGNLYTTHLPTIPDFPHSYTFTFFTASQILKVHTNTDPDLDSKESNGKIITEAVPDLTLPKLSSRINNGTKWFQRICTLHSINVQVLHTNFLNSVSVQCTVVPYSTSEHSTLKFRSL
jgi:hypothetical protein